MTEMKFQEEVYKATDDLYFYYREHDKPGPADIGEMRKHLKNRGYEWVVILKALDYFS